MKHAQTIILILVVIVIIGSIFYLQSKKLTPPAQQDREDVEIKLDPALMNKADKIKRYEIAKEITTPDGFINIDTISVSELVGKKVILIDFWTYSCINCQRTMPYLNAWHEKYKDKGLVIIGVHTPEFRFEQKYENVLAAVKKFNIQYPVVLDNDYSTWRAYKNRYWPRKYLIDIDGFIVYDHIGEGAYEKTERKIQEVLKERMARFGIQEGVVQEIVKPEGTEKVDFLVQRSPEIYFGAARNSLLGNGKRNIVGIQTLFEPTKIKTNVLYLVGVWELTDEFGENKSPHAKIIFRYSAQKVFFVASSENGVNVQILRDGVPLNNEAGRDIEKDEGNSTLFIKQDGLYRLIEDPQGHGKHTLEIIIENPGLRVFTFTFG
ncbi:redoxin domain-containing protein [Patescibacteria group bacterium AH-259-L07]|nr:redoxin domain-containing protein [Patescibacteria group bacterium AH-259-L07]